MPYLRVIRLFDPWKSPLCTCPRKYSLHPYTGCSHFCLYCYATSYIGRRPSTPKNMFLRNLRSDLKRINKNLVVEISTSSDPYPPVEKWLLLTRKTLELLVEHKVKTLITTKGSIVVRDIDLLLMTPSAVMITITTLDNRIAKIMEPGAPTPDKRVEAVKQLAESKIPVGVRIDPIIPGINDDFYSIKELIDQVIDAGAKHVVVSTYKARWDNLKRMIEAFPECSEYWQKLYIIDGKRIHGYMYLDRSLREKILKPIIDYAQSKKITIATCREGLGPEYFKAPSCDGTHLIRFHPGMK
ncbi:MAG: radical SAM protein [Staphylothermus sp.]|nr:radical SAM protein [Staphylothermus sp.]